MEQQQAGAIAPPAGRVRRVRSDRPLDLDAVLGVFRRGRGDPTSRREADGTWWLARRTPDGPATLRVRTATRAPVRATAEAGAQVTATAWGPGGGWLLDSLPDLLGEGDEDAGFVAHHPLVAEARRRRPGWRVPRSRLVLEALVPAVIEQRVTGAEAFAGYRRLVRRFGDPAPGPGAALGLAVAPAPRDWAAIPSWEWLRAGVDGARSSTVVRCAGYAGRVEECADLPAEAARARLRALPGVGVWTAAEVAQRALGDPDSPSFGDYHVAKDVGWALTGAPCDDAGLAELLAPYAGHRYRVQRLLELHGASRPRRGPRMPVPGHLPVRPRGR